LVRAVTVPTTAGVDDRNTDSPLVSVITIFWNAPVSFFGEAVDSVLAQTEHRWELLLVDDGSTDDSAAFARQMAAEHPARIRVLQHPDGGRHGMSASRNRGIQAACAPYIAFLDADDVYLPEKLERQLAILAANPDAGIVFGPTEHWWSWTADPADRGRDTARRTGAPPGTLVPPPELVRANLERRADTPATCGVLLRRTAIQSVGGFDSVFRDLYEDQAFFFKLLLTYPAYVTAQAWDRYRRHPQAMCEVRIRDGVHADDYSLTAPRRAFLEWLERYFEVAGIHDPVLRGLLDKELWPYRHPRRHRMRQRVMVSTKRLARSALPRGVHSTVRQLIEGRRVRR
jgi:glycosyltransferase involved in cell wall biosynthesis